ncbi:MAG: AAA family ATPase [Candidatus Aenigmarchaeota archaeon]|nr:AAA family ATPase [Candidatus Aenigmarchaeota archaeon]
MERKKTCIPGVDQLIEGGIPDGDLVLLSGTCGAGKTIFGLQFLCMSDEPGIYVSFEEDIEKLKDTAAMLGWDADKLERDKGLSFLKYDPFKIEDVFDIVESNIREIKAKRVVIDSISALGIYEKDPAELRRMILQISSMLRKNSCTSIMISETMPGTLKLSRFGVEEFVSDGVILLHNFSIGGEYRRALSIWKMRSTEHSKKIHPYKITHKGFIVYPEDTVRVVK